MTPPQGSGGKGGGKPKRPGNQGARKSTRKGPSTGTGGHGRRRLEGKGPTPKATDRTGHPAARRAAAAKRATERGAERGAPRRHDAPGRGHGDVVIGRNAVVEALEAHVPATALTAAAGLEVDKRVREALRLAQTQGIAVRELPRSDVDRLAGSAGHQGLVLAVRPYDYADPLDLLAQAEASTTPALLVALDGVTDPRNLGAIVRSAAAFGAHGVVVPARRSAGMTAGAWKASAGAAARVPVAQATNLARTLRVYADAGLLVAGLAADGTVALRELDATGPLVLVVGSEGRGLSRLVGEHCDVRVAIPLAAGTESLNAGVAAGIALNSVAEARETTS